MVLSWDWGKMLSVSGLVAIDSWPPKPPKNFSVGIFEYILASMPNVYLNV